MKVTIEGKLPDMKVTFHINSEADLIKFHDEVAIKCSAPGRFIGDIYTSLPRVKGGLLYYREYEFKSIEEEL